LLQDGVDRTLREVRRIAVLPQLAPDERAQLGAHGLLLGPVDVAAPRVIDTRDPIHVGCGQLALRPADHRAELTRVDEQHLAELLAADWAA